MAIRRIDRAGCRRKDQKSDDEVTLRGINVFCRI
jgi:hypothetical protein